jgi:hypothetical protein
MSDQSPSCRNVRRDILESSTSLYYSRSSISGSFQNINKKAQRILGFKNDVNIRAWRASTWA